MNQLGVSGDEPHELDALVGREQTAYAYDLGDRLTAITPAGQVATAFTLDALGLAPPALLKSRFRLGTSCREPDELNPQTV